MAEFKGTVVSSRLISVHSLTLSNTALKIDRALEFCHATEDVTKIRWCINFSEKAV